MVSPGSKPCPYCGSLRGADDLFCGQCGKQLGITPTIPSGALQQGRITRILDTTLPMYTPEPTLPAYTPLPTPRFPSTKKLLVIIGVLVVLLIGSLSFALGQALKSNSQASTRNTPSSSNQQATPHATPTVALPTPTATATPTPSPTPTPTPIPTPTPTPFPKPGTVIYQADWSSGMNGWFNGSSQWNTVNGMLVSNSKLYYPDFPDAAATAPYKLDTTPDYAVEAQMQFVSCAYDHDCGFGIFLRWDNQGGYVGGIDAMSYGTGYAGIANIHTDHAYVCPTCGYMPIKHTDYTPSTDWHTYRVEVKGNDLKLFIDGALVVEVTDNTYLSGGQVGVESYNVQVNVRNFKIIAL